GAVDSGFGTMGIVTTPIGSGDDEATALAQQQDGILVAAGWTHNGTNRDFALVRYDLMGDPDTDFGTGGIVTTPIGAGNDEAFDLLVQPNGGIVAAGDASTTSFALARYLSLPGTTTSTTTVTTTSSTTVTTSSSTTTTDTI